MKDLKIILLVFFLATIAIASCKKDPEKEAEPIPVNPGPITPASGTVTLNFSNMVGDSTLVFHTKRYVTANNDSIRISLFKYYISNIKLTNNDGNIYTETNSYHLINAAAPGTCTFSLTNVPFGKYTGISFMIGVDSARNVSGAQTGALDPVNGMIWTWDTGYIMAKLEATSPQSPTGAILYAIIGYKGPYNVLKTVSPSFNNDTVRVSSTVSPVINFKTDVAEWFKTPAIINVATLHTIDATGPGARSVADNYEDMVSVKSIIN